jgi:hypothetical protein
MVLLKPSHRHVGAAVLLALGLAAWTTSCTTLDDLTAPSCAFALSSTSAAFSTQGGTGSVAVHTASSCTWSVTTNDAWVSFTTPTSGSGDGSISFTVAATNPGAPARSATLSVSGQSFTVSQSGGPACSYTAAPGSEQFPPTGGSGKVTVTTDAGCPWSATSQANWITITSGRNGTGNGTVNYTIAVNASKNSRSGTVIAAGRTVTISQGGALK